MSSFVDSEFFKNYSVTKIPRHWKDNRENVSIMKLWLELSFFLNAANNTHAHTHDGRTTLHKAIIDERIKGSDFNITCLFILYVNYIAQH